MVIIVNTAINDKFCYNERKYMLLYGRLKRININMKDRILDVIKKKPKHFSQIIKRDPELFGWIEKNTTSESAVFAERIYNALYNFSDLCPRGNVKKFKSISDGYGFCGHSSKCLCAKEFISKKVSDTKKQYSEERNEEINEKRNATSLLRYGVANNAQTQSAKAKHSMLYQDKDAVALISDKIKNTKWEKYGDSNYNNPVQIKKTLRKKFSKEYWEQRFPEKRIVELHDADLMREMYQTLPIEAIAKNLSVHPQTVYRHLNLHGIREPFKSSEELEVVNFLKEQGITNIIENTRRVLKSGKELDIYLPDYSLAIEYNGVYWHHEDVDHITRSYHKKKFDECRANGVHLITIFSTLWKSKPKIVKSILRNRLGLDTDSVFARQCVVADVSTHEAKAFLNQYHIQGYTTSSIRYGLKYNDELVALMTFSKSRTGMGIKEDAHELVRFCTSTRVVGGASKLLKHFLKNNEINKLISYSDNEWSNGDLYHVLGFDLDKDIPPSYWYIKPHVEKMFHRYNFAKHKLVEKGFDPLKTERQITREMGLMKLWDCGKKRWVYNPEK